MPKGSLIISIYNYYKYIEKAIDSVLTQTYQDFEIIVVDDGSGNDAGELVLEFGMLIYGSSLEEVKGIDDKQQMEDPHYLYPFSFAKSN